MTQTQEITNEAVEVQDAIVKAGGTLDHCLYGWEGTFFAVEARFDGRPVTVVCDQDNNEFRFVYTTVAPGKDPTDGVWVFTIDEALAQITGGK